MKKFIAIASLLTAAWVTYSAPALADYYNSNCSSYGNYGNCSGYDSNGGYYNSQTNQIGNFQYGSDRYRDRYGNQYEMQSDTQQIGNTTYGNYRYRTPNGDYNVRCTTQYIGSQVFTNCN